MKTTHTRFSIGAFFLLVGWVLLAFAEFNASYKMEVNAAPVGNGIVPTWTVFFQSHVGELAQILLPKLEHLPYLLIFVSPALAILLAFRSRQAQMPFLAGIVFLVLVDFAVLMAYDGGDRKGCEVCFIGFGLHMLFGLVSLVISTIFFISATARRHHV
jgi:hypothetical protein